MSQPQQGHTQDADISPLALDADPLEQVMLATEGLGSALTDPADDEQTAGTRAQDLQRQRNFSVLVLAVLITSVAAALYGLFLSRHLHALLDLPMPWLLLAGLFVGAELLFVTLRTRRSAHCVSLSEIPLVIGLMTVTPLALLTARLTGSIIGLSLTHRGRGLRLLFNLSLHALETCVAASAYLLLLDGATPLSLRGWLAALGAVLVSDAISAVLVILVIVTHDDDRGEWRRLPRDLARGSVVASTNTCVALVAALSINQQRAAALPLLAMAVVAYLAYNRYVTRSEAASRVERLYDFTRRLSGTINVADIVPIVLSQVREESRGRAAELIIPRSCLVEATAADALAAAKASHPSNIGQPSYIGPAAATPHIDDLPLSTPRLQQWHLDDSGCTHHEVDQASTQWWQAALTGFPVLLTAHAGLTRNPYAGAVPFGPLGPLGPREGNQADGSALSWRERGRALLTGLRPAVKGHTHPHSDHPRDGMAVPVVLDDGKVAVLTVERSLPDLGTFSRGDLRLFQAMANHAAVALGKARLVERLRRQATEQEQIALHDSLTALPNRRYFTSLLTAVLDDPETDVAVLLLDLNGFKDVNDTLGHDIGDELLQEVGARLTSWLRGRGLVARLGGDEFAVLLAGVSGAEEACAVGEELARCVAVPFRLDQLTLEVRVSVGVALASQHGREARTLLQRADVAMYAAKGRDQGMALYRPENDHNSRRRLTLVSGLRSAIENGDMYLCYQPQIDPGTNKVHSMEALIRWKHPEHGLVEPDEFISLAEHSGLIRPLTLFVVETALAQVQQWRSRGIGWSVAVNVSTRNLLDARLPADIARLLVQAQVPAQALTIEITESSIMADRAAEVLERISELGVEVSVDDFGTGYSSLGYLQRLHVHEIKVDQSFVHALMASNQDRSIVSAIIHLGHELGLRVVAEGVEDVQTLAYLRQLGCDLVQGYVHAAPMESGQIERWLLDRHDPRHLTSVHS